VTIKPITLLALILLLFSVHQAHAAPVIAIDSATFGLVANPATPGANCSSSAITEGNATRAVTAQCGPYDYQCKVSGNILPSAKLPNCYQGLTITYRCFGNFPRTIGSGGVSSNASDITLDCTQPYPFLLEATYGDPISPATNSACKTILPGNATTQTIANCDNATYSCKGKINLNKYGGDPAPGCYKGFTATYRCPLGDIRTYKLPGESNGEEYDFNCEMPIAIDTTTQSTLTVKSETLPADYYFNSISCQGPTCVAGGYNYLVKSSNGGKSWLTSSAYKFGKTRADVINTVVSHNQSSWVATGYNNNGNSNLTSSDGIKWYGPDSPIYQNILAVTPAGGSSYYAFPNDNGIPLGYYKSLINTQEKSNWEYTGPSTDSFIGGTPLSATWDRITPKGSPAIPCVVTGTGWIATGHSATGNVKCGYKMKKTFPKNGTGVGPYLGSSTILINNQINIVVVGQYGNNGIVFYSDDNGESWEYSIVDGVPLSAVACSDTQCLAVSEGAPGKALLMDANDIDSWEVVNLGGVTTGMTGVSWSDDSTGLVENAFVAVGHNLSHRIDPQIPTE